MYNGVAQHFHTSQCYKFKEDKKTTAIAILDNVKQVRHSPTPALALGFSGLIPFVAAPVYMVTSGVFEPDVAQAQLFYGASILSFLGGVRWGLTLPESSSQPPDWHNLGYSVTPSLIAWIGLIAPHSVGMLTVIAGLGLTGYMDLAMWGYPTWFKGMRFCLTFIAILSLWTSFVFKFILNDSKVDKELDVKSESQ
ncbi:transmembrane protein 69-like isoform X2 [Panulirus ornatus]|uniref:transmembrane protein 69-like isoform X2 n=1 Tax=Panulirus ornatus TaxID=150431 RepID=UPI003A8A96BF